mmetsp:Transcript_40626/g.56604  ORF Transcript_40626/g.56604 Transcript_40626/m.56604 type:complete len:164 (-) Transcript_40626:141-632(-)
MTVDPELLTGLGAAIAIFLSSTGAAISSAHAGVFAIRGTSMKDFLPIVIAGVLAIYGIIVGVILVGKFNSEITSAQGYRNLSAGLSVGLACWASGYGMSLFIKDLNEAGKPRSRTAESEPLLRNGNSLDAPVSHPPFVKLFMCLTFLEAIGLYGLIVALFLMG